LPDALETVYGTNPNDPDTDKDGCLDGREVGPSEMLGGRRNPLNFWDFYDTPDAANVRDKVVNIQDILRVARRFSANDAGGTAPINRLSDPFSAPPPEPAYHPAFDRFDPPPAAVEPDPTKREVWDLQAADGFITVVQDIRLVAAQFGHSCL